MHRRALVVLAIVVATSGCGAFASDGTATRTLTPAPVPTQSPTLEETPTRVAPGISSARITDVGALAERHVGVVTDTSYRWHEEYRERHLAGNGSFNASRSQWIVVENATTYRREGEIINLRDTVQRRSVREFAVYADGEVEYTSWNSPGNGQRVFRRNPDPGSNRDNAYLAASAIERYLSAGSVTVSRIDGGDRTSFVVVTSDGTSSSFDDVENYRARAVVSEDGFVRRLDVSFDASVRDHPVSVHYSFAYGQVGDATASPPEWIEAARAASGD